MANKQNLKETKSEVTFINPKPSSLRDIFGTQNVVGLKSRLDSLSRSTRVDEKTMNRRFTI